MLGVLLAGTVAFNVVADPYGAFDSLSPESLRDYRDHRSRISKAERLTQRDWNVVLLGSSRTEAGLDPADPAWGALGYNAGLRGGGLMETHLVAEFALDHARPDRLVICVDLAALDSRRGVRPEFEVSRFNPTLDVFKYWASKLFGRSNLRLSRKILRRARKNDLGKNRPDGFRRTYGMRGLDPRELFGKVISGYFLTEFNGFQYAPQRLDDLERVARECRRRGVALDIVVAPVHALMLEAMHISGVWDDFETMKRDLVRRVADANTVEAPGGEITLWDFTGYTGRLGEPLPTAGSEAPMNWFREASHFTPALGHELALRVQGLPEADPRFGARLTPEGIDAHLARVRADRDDYHAREAPDVAWLAQLLEAQRAERDRVGHRANAIATWTARKQPATD
jgi:hypothetical protein